MYLTYGMAILLMVAILLVILAFFGHFYLFTQRHTAWHEAGHTLIAWMLPRTRRVRSVEVDGFYKGGSGRCCWEAYDYDLERMDEASLYTHAIVYQAGEVADRMGRWWYPARKHTTTDWKWSVKSMEALVRRRYRQAGLGPPPTDQEIRGLKASAAAIREIRLCQEWIEEQLQANYPLLKRLSRQIWRRKRLTETELEEILGPLSESHKLAV